MASFYIHDGTQALTLQVIGELSGGEAKELEQTWLTARSTLAGRKLFVDLSGVTDVDGDGQAVLGRLAGQGAMFISASAWTDSLAEQVSQRTPELLPAPRLSLWSRLICCWRTFCGIAKASLKPASHCGPNVRKRW